MSTRVESSGSKSEVGKEEPKIVTGPSPSAMKVAQVFHDNKSRSRSSTVHNSNGKALLMEDIQSQLKKVKALHPQTMHRENSFVQKSNPLLIPKCNVQILTKIFRNQKQKPEIVERELLKFINKDEIESLVETLEECYKHLDQTQKIFFCNVFACLVKVKTECTQIDAKAENSLKDIKPDGNQTCKKLVISLCKKFKNSSNKKVLVEDLINAIHRKYVTDTKVYYELILALTEIDIIEEKLDETLFRGFSLSSSLAGLFIRHHLQLDEIKGMIKNELSHSEQYDLRDSKPEIFNKLKPEEQAKKLVKQRKFEKLGKEIIHKVYHLFLSKECTGLIKDRIRIAIEHFPKNKINRESMIGDMLFLRAINSEINSLGCSEHNVVQIDFLVSITSLLQKIAVNEEFEPSNDRYFLNSLIKESQIARNAFFSQI